MKAIRGVQSAIGRAIFNVHMRALAGALEEIT